ncbi:hypothetical protein EBR66_06210, partial [bacterium]|nr:hypothetical protein [bacterium]
MSDTTQQSLSALASAVALLNEKMAQSLRTIDARLTSQQGTYISGGGGGYVPSYANTYGLSQKIDELTNTKITNPTISGGTITGASVAVNTLSGVVGVQNGGTGTSTAPSYGYLLIGNTTGGYDLVASSSLVSGANLSSYFSLSDWFSTTTDALTEGSTNKYYTDTRVNSYLNASTTIPKSYAVNTFTNGNLFFASSTALSLTVGNSTTTNATTTRLNVASSITGAGLSACSLSSDKLLYNASTGQFTCGADAGAGGGITALKAQYSPNQTGSSQTFATSSDTNIQLVITSSGDTHTFTPAWTGTLAALRGGTGLSTIASSSLLVGGTGNTWLQMATSSLGLPTFSDLGAYLSLASWYATTTDALLEGTNNKYYTDTRVNTYVNSSTTIPKTYTANTFTGLQTFQNSTTTLASFTYASSTNLLTAYATSTNLALPSLTSTLLKTNSQGQLVAAVAGTDYANFSYLFPSAATSTTLTFSSGLLSLASTTIGNGTATGGLTISGNSTTTGTAYFSGNLGIGTSTPGSLLSIGNTNGINFTSAT